MSPSQTLNPADADRVFYVFPCLSPLSYRGGGKFANPL
jgi:hypothetical protein